MSNKRKPAAAKKAAPRKADLGENPFQIEKGVTFTGNRRSGLIALQLFEKVKELPIDKEVSILIPRNVATKATEASNLVLGVRRLISEDKNIAKDFTIALKTYKDAKGQYVNARVWRIN